MSGDILETAEDIVSVPAEIVRGTAGLVKGSSEDAQSGFTPTPKAPGPPVVPTPETTAPDAEEAAQRERAPRQGRASTILTGGQGLLDEEDGRNLSRRVLLGS